MLFIEENEEWHQEAGSWEILTNGKRRGGDPCRPTWVILNSFGDFLRRRHVVFDFSSNYKLKFPVYSQNNSLGPKTHTSGGS
jgi:hypothetical protein